VCVLKLSLDHNKQHAFVRHLNRVSMPQLMWREAPSHAGAGGRVMQLLVCGRGVTVPAGVGPWITHSSDPIGSRRRTSIHGSS
jgi:hypothetical protein